ncbi:hypothetical protein BOO71_0004972 [Deinococcus marmoris]|uniref:Uncharacterized protein n=1 Tax=Deinococcus marmoris TaxID=249408 RepID=A0A1U7P0F6_9DEIO|nr:hypothetical protein BOO71_0009499 [Deinococcus marmoris]OLV18644.1 hypothetical protein BOO71_0004972 [Deinococcus marmoris]
MNWNQALFPQAGPLRVVQGEARREEPSFFPPTHLELQLQGAPDAYGIETTVSIYPLAALLQKYPEQTEGSVGQQVKALRSLLENPAPLNTAAAFRLPAIDTVNASLAVAGARKSLSSANLRGVRYLGAFSQDVRRFASTDVRYVFQGISRDGRYLVTVNGSFSGNVLPTRESLEGSGYDVAPQPQDNDKDRARYEGEVNTYFAGVNSTLDQSNSNPEVTRLDQFVELLQLR